MEAVSSGMNPVSREVMRPTDPRQVASADARAAGRACAGTRRATFCARVAQPSAVVTLARRAWRGRGAAACAGSSVEARAIEQARAAAANGDVRSNYSAQRALASYEAMSQVGANNAAAPEPA